MVKQIKCIKYYHDNFEGDTYDACAKCGGKCEKFKVSTLMPGEKEYMVKELNIQMEVLEGRYLSKINTPYGNVDVLKMKDGCNFLDKEYHCTAIPAKPVMCDSYPIVFSLHKKSVKFEIDQRDCPMVHWKKYKDAVDTFATRGIKTMKELKVPFSWWKIVALFDEFDFDYVSIEKNLAKTKGYETFYLEKLLGYTCNGYEKKAYRLGISIMEERFRILQKKSIRTLNRHLKSGNWKVLLLGRAYKYLILDQIRQTVSHLKNQITIHEALSDSQKYLDLIDQGFRILLQTEETYKSFVKRLKEVKRYTDSRKKVPRRKLLQIETITPEFITENNEKTAGWSFFEITDVNSLEFWNAIALLNKSFLPNELDSPIFYIKHHKGEKYHAGFISTIVNEGIAEKIWYKWILVGVKDEKGKFIGVADGALIVNKETSLFYFSHIAVKDKYRKKGIGSTLTSATLQAANLSYPIALKSLKIDLIDAGDLPIIDCEICEIEFPDTSFAGLSSINRLPFHGRQNRMVIWPLCYAQPDTDYQNKEFYPKEWNSVPMFLAYRSFSNHKNNIIMALKAAGLLYDYFNCSMSFGVGFDKKYMIEALNPNKLPTLICLPKHKSGINDFIEKTGTLPEILKKYFPDHKFTKDYFHN
jgi:Fe-S-cluster containining protein/predicted GNAT family acetyltransferase